MDALLERPTAVKRGIVLVGLMSALLVACDDGRFPWLKEAAKTIETARKPSGPPKRIFAKRFVATAFAEPAMDAPRLGYLRAGTVVQSPDPKPVGYEGCPGGWYTLSTGGYVCDGIHVIAFLGEKLPELRGKQADLEGKLPYRYATVREPTPEFQRLPTAVQLQALSSVADGGAPSAELDSGGIVRRILQPGFYVSLDRQFNKQGHTYWRTQHNGFVEAERLRGREGSNFSGVELGGRHPSLPVAYVRRKGAPIYRKSSPTTLRTLATPGHRRTRFFVSGKEQVANVGYVRSTDGRYVREQDVTLVEAQRLPEGVGDDERWIDIDLTDQTLVAYEGRAPVFVTLVSTGRVRHPEDPIESSRTPAGLYRVRAKHLTSTMDGGDEVEGPYSLDDVPYVMYFHGAYAFHTAFWHDLFGRPKSHGCINLAPHDAKWLYNWAGPDIPAAWHGGYANDDNPGTWVQVRGETPVW